MSDIDNAAHPQWRQLCQAALFELNPVKLLERIARARNAVLDRIERRSFEIAEWRTSRAAGSIGYARQFGQNYGASKWLSVKS
jgi:hypothetical protein